MNKSMASNIERAKLVKTERDKRAWPQRQLAEAARLDIRTIQRLEKDGRASRETLMAVAGAFNINVELLMNPDSKSQNARPRSKVHFLPRLTAGKDFAEIIRGADQFQVEHDKDGSAKALSFMVSILEVLKGDLVRWYDGDPVEKLKVELEVTKAIEELRACGFCLFGVKHTIPRIVGNEKTLTSMCTIYMSHLRSPKIVRDRNANMAIPAVLTEIAQ
jgi:transcriptional regulator with XRE-family HTH domain